MSNYIVWNPDNIYEIELANRLGINLFDNGEIVTSETDAKITTRKKIVIKDWWYWQGTTASTEDLSWADLLICYTGELINGPWDAYYNQTVKQFNNTNFICVSSGKYNLIDYPTNIVYEDLGHFFTRITDFCQYTPWSVADNKPKLFDVLLGSINKTKPHRVFLLSSLSKHGLLDSSFVNAWGSINYTTPGLIDFDDKAIVNRNDSIVHVDGMQNGFSMGHSIPIEIYKRSWYSIVAETNPSKSNFLTEKTAKPLFQKKIFVMFGSQGILKQLRELGYQTFGNVIDESYDNEPNDNIRWHRAFDQVLKLSQADHQLVYKNIDTILEHNHQLICNQTARLQKLKNFLNKHI